VPKNKNKNCSIAISNILNMNTPVSIYLKVGVAHLKKKKKVFQMLKTALIFKRRPCSLGDRSIV